MIFNIIQSGSSGNATLIDNNILIDCGVGFNKLAPFYKELQLVIIGHIHLDHFNKSTIKRLALERPTLRFGCGEWLADGLKALGVKNIDVYQENTTYNYGSFQIKMNEVKHNVRNCCYHVVKANKRLFYCTDMNNLDNITAKDYDFYLVENNYSEADIIERIQQKQELGQYIYEYDVLENHMSKEKIDKWLAENMGIYSDYVYMHSHVEVEL